MSTDASGTLNKNVSPVRSFVIKEDTSRVDSKPIVLFDYSRIGDNVGASVAETTCNLHHIESDNSIQCQTDSFHNDSDAGDSADMEEWNNEEEYQLSDENLEKEEEAAMKGKTRFADDVNNESIIKASIGAHESGHGTTDRENTVGDAMSANKSTISSSCSLLPESCMSECKSDKSKTTVYQRDKVQDDTDDCMAVVGKAHCRFLTSTTFRNRKEKKLVGKRKHSGTQVDQCSSISESLQSALQSNTSEVTDEQTYIGGRTHRCSYCSKVFVCASHRITHERAHTGEKYPCSYCPKTFTRLYNKNNHEMTHSNEKPYQCSYCPQRFWLVTYKEEHQKIHAGEKYPCSFCPKTFTRLYDKNNHEMSHSDEKPYQCSYCPQRFWLVTNKVEHQRTHIGEKMYQCSFCSKRFAHLSTRNSHERIHTGEKPYQCSFCAKRFRDSSGKNVHERTHTRDELYQCSFCYKIFYCLKVKEVHERTHTGEKPYQCSYCPKAFCQGTTRKRHERTHTGEKPYQCTHCPKAFSRSDNLTAHERKHVAEKRI